MIGRSGGVNKGGGVVDAVWIGRGKDGQFVFVIIVRRSWKKFSK